MCGDGMIGENIIENLKIICFILLWIKELLLMEVCGEVFMLRKLFKVFNEVKMERDEVLFVNFCNVVVGLLC